MLKKLLSVEKTLRKEAKRPGLNWHQGYYYREAANYIHRLETLEKLAKIGADDFSFHVESLEGLHEVRKKLREALGTWSDKLEFVGGPSMSNLCAKYRGVDENIITIEFRFSEEKMPEGLMSATCRLDEIVSESPACRETYIRMVCDG